MNKLYKSKPLIYAEIFILTVDMQTSPQRSIRQIHRVGISVYNFKETTYFNEICLLNNNSNHNSA